MIFRATHCVCLRRREREFNGRTIIISEPAVKKKKDGKKPEASTRPTRASAPSANVYTHSPLRDDMSSFSSVRVVLFP